MQRTLKMAFVLALSRGAGSCINRVMNPELAIDIRGLKKTYGKGPKAKVALKGVDLDVRRGAFFGLLGPNGAGKSTMINILAGLVVKTAGNAEIWGWDIARNPREAKRAIGVVPQELNIDPFFSPREALELQAGLYGVPKKARRTDEILEAVGLTDQAATHAAFRVACAAAFWLPRQWSTIRR
jgi:ABC-2 type transport system ATP-binding protein